MSKLGTTTFEFETTVEIPVRVVAQVEAAVGGDGISKEITILKIEATTPDGKPTELRVSDEIGGYLHDEAEDEVYSWD